MTFYLGFDPSNFTDEELITKQMELEKKAVWASRFGSGEMLTSIQQMLGVIGQERFDRYARSVYVDQQAMFPAVIESDPDLGGTTRPQSPKTETKRNQPARAQITKTARPTLNPPSE